MGKLIQFTVLSLVTFLSLSDVGAQAQYQKFDYFVLALTWPTSLCNTGKPCTSKPTADFTIHGLWPNNVNGPLLISCYTVSYSPIQDGGLLDRLKEHWPDLREGRHESFWMYEWEKHGVCSLSCYDQNTYFYLATMLMIQNKNLFATLMSNGIIPSDGVAYRSDLIREVVKRFTKKYPELYCNLDQNRNVQLSEIWICYNKYGKTIDCPTNRQQSCPDLVIFPWEQ